MAAPTHAAMPNTPLQFIGTGFRFISWESVHPDLMQLAYDRLVLSGISRFVVLDPMHDMDAVRRTASMIRAAGAAEIIGALVYTISAVHDDQLYANLAGQTYPDQSLYPCSSAPALVRRLNNALLRADQIHAAEGDTDRYWLAPIVADAEAGFGGPLNAFELMKAFIEAGAAGVHFEDQLSSEKKCGHLGGKVLVPTSHFLRILAAARLAADVCGVPTVLVARTDALSATLLTSDADPLDEQFLTGERTPEGFFRVREGLDAAIARGRAAAPYADLVWFETSTPDMGEAREFAQAVHEEFPGKLLAYNCSPSFNWRKHLDDSEIASFQEDLAELGYRFQFVTLAGFHSLNAAMFELARGYAEDGMSAYVRLQESEFAFEEDGYTATRHQREVGAGYFDAVVQALGESSTLALEGSTEAAQFRT